MMVARRNLPQFRFGFALALVMVAGSGQSETSTGVVAESGLRYWQWHAEGVLFRLTQRLPDQTRAFFLARNFDPVSADLVATQCVFQSMFRNTGDPDSGEVHIDQEQWIIEANGRPSSLLTREHWKAKLASRGLATGALIAFEWSLLPTRQTYQPGDYNWGMTSYGLEPGAQFDLEFSWRRNGRLFSGVLSDVQCPHDIHPEPPQSR